MDFTLPEDLRDYLAELDEFIEREIRPLELENDNIRFFDHRREDARTDWDRGGLPSREWEALLAEARRRADAAGHYRYAFPKEYGGRDGTNLGMAVIREHLARKGLGLHCDLQNEHAIVGNNVGLLLMLHYGSAEQKADWVDDLAAGPKALRVRHHRARPRQRRDVHGDPRGPRRRRLGDQRREDLEHRHPHRNARPGLRPHQRHARQRHRASPVSSSRSVPPASRSRSTCGPSTCPPTTRTSRSPTSASRTAPSSVTEGRGLAIVQHFFNENRIRQAASSLGAAQFCIDRSVAYAKDT